MAQVLRFHLDLPQLHAAFTHLEAALSRIGDRGQVQLNVANALYPQARHTLAAGVSGPDGSILWRAANGR